MKTYLQNMVDDISFDSLPEKWTNFNFTKFSLDKSLFDFQKGGLCNALKALYLFYVEKKANKKQYFAHYKSNDFKEEFDYDLKKKQDGKTAKFLMEYSADYPLIDNKISFEHFINRMSFWMATGSGKTLIIVKLIELLGYLIKEKEIPKNDILFLAHRQDLLDQFKLHVEEFNSFNFDTKINLKSLREYEDVKQERIVPYAKNEITIFYYRSDLISDEQKEKYVNYKNYDNNGKWYILLDEAHKGDKEDSKRQILYSILSRNGFLFNFSATFIDPRDYATCIFNFNLSKFIQEGYGKHIYVSGSEVTAFKNKNDFSKSEKQKIVLKSIILLSYINTHFIKIRQENETLFHRPLLMILVNSVDTKDSDLKMFFSEIEKIAKNEVDKKLFQEAKDEIISELGNNSLYEFEDLQVTINKDLIKNINYKDLLQKVFNSDSAGNIEVLKIPENNNELIFKLKTAEKPFALIKIGDISGWLKWLKEKKEGFEIIETFENESIFNKINHNDSAINILLGSRSFYEGWDSNRPNLLLFVNIGVGTDAKKFVLQSIGRGVRIEPQKNKRKRMQNLFNSREIDGELFNKVRQDILPIESLYVFGTNSENLREIIKALKEEQLEKRLGNLFNLNKQVENYLLLIPNYKKSTKTIAEEIIPQKYSISEYDFELTKNYLKHIGKKIALVKYDCPPKVIEITNESIQNKDEKESRYDFAETRSIAEPELILNRILNYFSVKQEEFENFKKLENEIVHFKRITYSGESKYDEIKMKLTQIFEYPAKKKELNKQYGKIPQEEFAKKQADLINLGEFELKNQKIKIKYLTNHYFLPIIVSEKEKVDYLTHIIDVESEIDFVDKLEKYLEQKNNVFEQYDWWMFSKLDETLDEIYIPYYNPKENTVSKFKPDFIFWAQKEKEYTILFVDPKGTEHTDGFRKIDGFVNIFENEKLKPGKSFSYDNYTIKIKLLLKPKKGLAEIPDKYKKYWFDNFADFGNKIK